MSEGSQEALADIDSLSALLKQAITEIADAGETIVDSIDFDRLSATEQLASVRKTLRKAIAQKALNTAFGRYTPPTGAAAFTTVATNGDRITDNANTNFKKLKWQRPVDLVKTDEITEGKAAVAKYTGEKATAINFAFGPGLENLTGINSEQVQSLFARALGTWAQHAPLVFQQVEYNRAASEEDNASAIDILVQGKNIDGKSNTLAEAYFPGRGDINIDNSEDWNPLKFLEVAVHEIGHSLGLDHQDGIEAIMNSRLGNRFTTVDQPFLLDDDIAGIQNLYGVGTGSVEANGKLIPPIPTNPIPAGSVATPPVPPEVIASPNLVANGSFEIIPLNDGESGLYSRINSWSLVSGTGFRIEKSAPVVGETAESSVESRAWASLDIYNDNGTIGQNIDTLTGQAYRLSLDYSNGGLDQATAGVDVFWEGQRVGELTGGGLNVWETFSYDVMGSDRDISTLAFRATGTADSVGGLLDNISVQAISPASLSIQASAFPSTFSEVSSWV